MRAGKLDRLYRDREVTCGLRHRPVERDECQTSLLGDSHMQGVPGANAQRMMVGHDRSTIEMTRIDRDQGEAIRQECLPCIQHLRFIGCGQRAGSDSDGERTVQFGHRPMADEEAACRPIAKPVANGCAARLVNQCRYQHGGVKIVAQ